MKYPIAFFAIFQLLISYGYSQSNSHRTFLVERYRTSAYAFGGRVAEITEKRKYSGDNDPLFKVEYHGLQLFDSTVYINQNQKIIKMIVFNNMYGIRERENIDYIYQKDSLVDIKVNKTDFSNATKEDYLNYIPKINSYGFKDPLGLLENDFADFEIDGVKKLKRIYLKQGLKTIFKEGYIINQKPLGLFEYAVPHDTYLQRVNLYYTGDKTLLKDEFIYDGLVLRREYYYATQGIKSIKVIKLKNHKIISTDKITFKYILI